MRRSVVLGLVGVLAFALGAVTFMPGGLWDRSEADVVTYKPMNVPNWTPKTSASAMALLEPIFATHPRRLEGRPALKIEMSKRDDRLVAIVELTGFLDDSVDGSRHRAEIVRSADGWTLKSLGVAHRCAREMTAMWTTRPCV